MSEEVEPSSTAAPGGAAAGVGFRSAAELLKEEGNASFAAREYKEAAASYRAALAQARCGGGAGAVYLEALCHSNISQCQLLQGDYAGALAAADCALALARGPGAAAAAAAAGSSSSKSGSSAVTHSSSAGSGGGSGGGGGSGSGSPGSSGGGGGSGAAAAGAALPPTLVEKCLLRRARALRGLQRDKEALQAYKVLLSFSPSSVDGRRELAALLPPPPPRQATPAQGLAARMAGAMRAVPGAVYDDQPDIVPGSSSSSSEEAEEGGWESGCCYQLWAGLCCCFRGRRVDKAD